jgi:peptidoglycan/LPS O-acetylase OafA/YrhL
MKSIKLLLGHLFPQALYRNSQNDHGRLDAIDGLRALAVLSVIAYHFNIGFAPTGFVGVDIFFVISGYVITLSLTKNQSSSIIQYILAFYKRRILRIMPALVVCLIIVGAVSQLFVPNSWLSSRNDTTGLYSFFGISNFALLEGLDGYFNDRAEFNPFLHTWSLAVEEQFYLFFPLLLLPWLRQVIENDSSSRIRRHLVLAKIGRAHV